jgi:small subunit ribosomal protein S6
MAVRKLRKYELIYVVQPEATDEDRSKITDRVREIIDRLEGKVVLEEDWGKRKLAYEIRKFNKGFYHYFVFGAYPGTTQEIERNLRMLDNCVRYLTVKLEDAATAESLVPPPPTERQRRPMLDRDAFEDDEPFGDEEAEDA